MIAANTTRGARPRPAATPRRQEEGLRYAAYARHRPAPVDRVEAALRRLDSLAWRLARAGRRPAP